MLRDHFEALFEHSVDGVFFMTLDEPFDWHGAPDQEALLDYAYEHLRVTAVNRALCEQMRATREELVGSSPSARWSQNIPLWRAKMRELFDSGRMYQSVRAPRGDGTWMDVEGQYVCTYDEQGRISGYFGTQRDVTDKRKTAERLELALASGDIGIWDMELASQTIYFDSHWIERLGYSPRAPEVRSLAWWGTLIHPSDRASTARAFEDHVSGRAPLYRSEHRLRKANGEWLWLLSSGKLMSDAHGSPSRMVGASVDVTERKQLQERLYLAERMASIGTLAAGVGHEINNPLTCIVLNLTLIERELERAELPSAAHARLQHMIEQARYGTERVRKIVRDLQALARVPEDDLAPVQIAPVLERCLEIADHQIRHRARVIRELADVPPVLGSEGRMVQLFLNLLVNAAQAIPVGGAEANWIKVAVAAEGDRVLVTISDSGVGIAPEAIGRIFDPFYTTKPVGEGTGLGLAICRSIVTGMGGDIVADSTPGRGTTFRVLLPAAPQPEPKTDAPSPPPAPVAPPRKRVLVIDDEPIVGQLVTKLLADHDVVTETSGRAALARLAGGDRFDRILCDVMMPELSGMDFYAELGRLEPGLRSRVVFLSGGAFTENAQRFLDSVPNRRLAKPFDVDALTAVLISPDDHDPLP